MIKFDKNTLHFFLLIAFITIVLCACQLLVNSVVEAREVRVLRVVNADIFVITYDGKPSYVNLRNVDAPKYKESTDIGKKAFEHSKRMLENQSVELEAQDSPGKYGEISAYVHLHGLNYNVEMVRIGFSPYYTNDGISPKYDAQFREAEEFAKSYGLNIWRKK
jgi:endonuclease YncB( thermonuclease family)